MTGLRPDIVVKTPVAISRRCKFCHDIHDSRACPKVKAFNYHPDGTLARVEFWPAEAQVVSMWQPEAVDALR